MHTGKVWNNSAVCPHVLTGNLCSMNNTLFSRTNGRTLWFVFVHVHGVNNNNTISIEIIKTNMMVFFLLIRLVCKTSSVSTGKFGLVPNGNISALN